MITLEEAVEQKIERVRSPKWANAFDHLQLKYLPDGNPYPWADLWCPFNKRCNGHDPVRVLLIAMNIKAEIEPYTGPLPDSKEYLAEVAQFERMP